MREMAIRLFYQVTMVIFACRAYEIKCPSSRNWHYRATLKCKNETNYMCLLDEMNWSYTEKCSKPTGISKGAKLVLRRGMTNSPCGITRYQPRPFLTTENSDCVYQKSLCNGEGLIVNNIGTNASDTTCRCDYRKGYTFVMKPNNTCYCLPLSEDCSCYRRKCKTLTQDYICLQEDPFVLGIKCPNILNNVNEIDKHEVIVHHHKESDLKTKDINVSKLIIRSSLIGILVIFCVVGILVVGRRSILHHTDGTHVKRNVRQSDRVLPGKEENIKAEEARKDYELKGEKEKNTAQVIKNKVIKKDLRLEDEDKFTRQTSQSSVKESTQTKFVQKIVEVWKKRDDIIYFKTSCFKIVLDNLEKHHCVTLIGASGEGKTLTAIHAALEYRKKTTPYDVLIIDNSNELINSIDLEKNQFIVIDDPLGTQCLNEPSLVGWVQLSRKLRDSLQIGKIKIIATIRKPLFQKYKMRIKETIFNTSIIDLSSEENRLSVLERKGILEHNIKFTGKTLDLQIIEAIANDTYYPGFPLFCLFLSSNPNRVSHIKVDPCVVLIEHLNDLKSEPYHYCCLVLAFMFDNVFDINDFTFCEDIELPDPEMADTKKILNILKSCNINIEDENCFAKLISGFEALSGAYFINNRPVYKILHDSITSALAHTYGIDNILILLEYSGLSIIREYVRTKSDTSISTFATSDVDSVQIIVQPKYQGKLAKRFIRELKKGESGNVFLNPCFIDKNFEEKFLKALMALDTSELIDMMSIAPETANMQLKEIREYTKFALDDAILKSTPIHWLCRLGLHKVLTAVLLKTDDKLSFLNNLPGHTTPLHFAAGYGHIEIVKYLIDLGVDINLKAQLELKTDEKIGEYYSGFPPLLYAARQNHPEVVEYMLQHGADPNLVRDHGGSPMLLAADRGHTEVIKHLLKYNGDPNLCCDHGTTPIILAAQDDHLETVLALIEGGADVNEQKNEKEGKTSALLAAAERGHTLCVKCLVENEAQIDLCDTEGSTPLLVALQNKRYDTAKYLYEKGGSINATNIKGESPNQLAKSLNLDILSDEGT